MKIRCIAIDDEPPALKQMQDYIEKVPFLELLGTFSNALDVLSFLNDQPVDLLFLDIEMEDLNGIQLLQVLKNKPKVILTTAYDQYAIKAFELDVADYLLKPISFERFLQAVEKIYTQHNHGRIKEPIQKLEEESEREYFFVKTEFRVQRVDFKDILYIEGLKEYLIIKTLNDKVLSLMTFKDILEILPSSNFVRTHKSYIVALNKIESIERSRIKIGDKLIPIGKTYKDQFYLVLEKLKLI